MLSSTKNCWRNHYRTRHEQKQFPKTALWKIYFQKLDTVHKKAIAIESFFSKVACFDISFMECLLSFKDTCKNIENKSRTKIPKFHLISWCENFMKRHSPHRVSCETPETLRKLGLSTDFPYQEIRRNFSILRSESLHQEGMCSEVFQSIFCRIQTEYGDLRSSFWILDDFSCIRDFQRMDLNNYLHLEYIVLRIMFLRKA